MYTTNPLQFIAMIARTMVALMWHMEHTPEPEAPPMTPPLDWVTQEMFRRAWVEARNIPVCFPDDQYDAYREMHRTLVFQVRGACCVLVLCTFILAPLLDKVLSRSFGGRGDPEEEDQDDADGDYDHDGCLRSPRLVEIIQDPEFVADLAAFLGLEHDIDVGVVVAMSEAVPVPIRIPIPRPLPPRRSPLPASLARSLATAMEVAICIVVAGAVFATLSVVRGMAMLTT